MAQYLLMDGVAPGAAGGILVSNGSAWIRATGATITDAGVMTLSGTFSGQALSATTGLFTSTLTVSAGGVSVTGASTVTGSLGGITTLTVGTKIVLSGTIVTGTLDGADNGSVQINGGGSNSVLRGGQITLFGNEVAAPYCGSVALTMGNASGACIAFRNGAEAVVGKVSDTGSFIWGTGTPLATTATDGFVYLPTCFGTPSGAPTNPGGAYPLVYDYSANKLWVWNGSWRSVALT